MARLLGIYQLDYVGINFVIVGETAKKTKNKVELEANIALTTVDRQKSLAKMKKM